MRKCRQCQTPYRVTLRSDHGHSWLQASHAYLLTDCDHLVIEQPPAGARATRMRRIAASAELGPLVRKLRGHEAECDSVFWARHDSDEDRALWLVTPVSHGTREEDAIADSNYSVAESRLTRASSFAELHQPRNMHGDPLPDWPAYWQSEGLGTRSDAWPGGVIETILVRADDAGALRELSRIISEIEGYPVLDEDHWSELEHERNHPSDHECYADEDEECGCDVAAHRRDIEDAGEAAAHAGRRTPTMTETRGARPAVPGSP